MKDLALKRKKSPEEQGKETRGIGEILVIIEAYILCKEECLLYPKGCKDCFFGKAIAEIDILWD